MIIVYRLLGFILILVLDLYYLKLVILSFVFNIFMKDLIFVKLEDLNIVFSLVLWLEILG